MESRDIYKQAFVKTFAGVVNSGEIRGTATGFFLDTSLN